MKRMVGESGRRSEATELGKVREAARSYGRGDVDGGCGGGAGEEDVARFGGEWTNGRGGKERVKVPWSREEDVLLIKLVEKFGPRNWSLIARSIPSRSGKSCRLRWCNQLDPSVKRNSFAEVEDQAIITAHAIHGNKWSAIAKLLPGRTDNAIKNHWNSILIHRCIDFEKVTTNTGTRNLVMEESGFDRTTNTIASSEATLSSRGGCHITTPLVSSEGKEATSMEMSEEEISKQECNDSPKLVRPVAQLSSFNQLQSSKQDTTMLRLLEESYSERLVPHCWVQSLWIT